MLRVLLSVMLVVGAVVVIEPAQANQKVFVKHKSHCGVFCRMKSRIKHRHQKRRVCHSCVKQVAPTYYPSYSSFSYTPSYSYTPKYYDNYYYNYYPTSYYNSISAPFAGGPTLNHSNNMYWINELQNWLDKWQPILNAPTPAKTRIEELPAPTPLANKKADAAQTILANAIRKNGSKSVNGKWNPHLCVETEKFAKTMAQRKSQTLNGVAHPGFEDRSKRIFQALGNETSKRVSEITAESPAVQGKSLAWHASECVKSWKKSNRHRITMDESHGNYCVSMKPANNGAMFCAAMFYN